MARIIEIIGIVFLILFIIGIWTMPWPANIVLGSIALSSCIVAFIYSWRAKKKEQDTEPTNKTNG